MSTSLEKRSSGYLKYEPYRLSSQCSIIKCVGDDESELDFISQSSESAIFLRTTITPPVYVIKTINGEQLVYKSDLMELNKPYPIVWRGEQFCLVKTESDIEVYKHENDKE